MTNLRITIPTYNRPDYIQRQIRDLLPQLQEGVSIVVYDNCSDIPVSTLFTKEELTEAKNRLKSLNYDVSNLNVEPLKPEPDNKDFIFKA